MRKRKSVNGRAWSPADDAELTRRRAEGLTWASIGAAIGRTANACKRRGDRLRLPPVGGWTPAEIAALDRLRAAGETWGAIGAALGRSEQAAKSWASANGRARRTAKGRAWSPADDRKLLHLYGCDLTHREIGAQLGRTAGATKKRMSARYLQRHATASRRTAAPMADPDYALRTLKGELAIGENYDY